MYKLEPKLGTQLVKERIVKEQDTATFYGSGGVDVLATPAMITLMENTCLNLVNPYLEQGWVTVGTEVNVKHIKATPIGMRVKCIAKLVDVDGPRLKFEVEMYDEQGKVGYGTHKRYVVNLKEFIQKVYSKN